MPPQWVSWQGPRKNVLFKLDLCVFFLIPVTFFGQLAMVNGLEKRSRRGVTSRCVKVVVLNLPSCRHFWDIRPLCYSRAIFSAYRKEMNSHHFSLPSFASCDDVVHPPLCDKDMCSQDQMLSQFSCDISTTVLLLRRSLFQWFERNFPLFKFGWAPLLLHFLW